MLPSTPPRCAGGRDAGDRPEPPCDADDRHRLDARDRRRRRATERDYLTQLDAAIGDGDHGINMNRGFDAVGKALAAQDGDAAARAGC